MIDKKSKLDDSEKEVQKKALSATEQDEVSSESEYENDEYDDSDEPAKPISRQSQSVQELLTKEICERASKSHDLLRSKIKGKIMIKVDPKQSYLFDFSTPDSKVARSTSGSADVTIELGEKDLLRIYNGMLNPQIAMLSEKIRVIGNPEMAVYFFNLVCP